MIHTLDKYQELGLEKALGNGVYILQGRSSSGKSYLIRNILNKKWAQGKSTLVVTNSLEEAKLIKHQLRAFQMSRYSIIIDELSNTDNAIFDVIDQLNQEAKVSISKKDIELNNLLFRHYDDKLKNHYGKLNKKILFNNSLNKIAIINGFEASSYSNINFNQIFNPQIFDFSEEEYSHLSKNVKIAYQFFLKGLNKTDKHFSEKAYSANDPEQIWGDIIEWLVRSKESAIRVIKRISGFLQEQSSKNFEQSWSKVRESEILIDESLLGIGKIDVVYKDIDKTQSSGFFNFNKASREIKEQYELDKQRITLNYKKIIRELNKVVSIKNNYVLPSEDVDDIRVIQENLVLIKNELKSYKNTINASVIKELKSMNFRNVEDETLSKIQLELANLFNYLNGGYAQKEWEDNAFSINKQLIWLESILDDLNDLEEQKLSFFRGFKWNKFLLDIDDKSKYFIQKLNTYKPDDWHVFLRNWFVQNLILNNKIQLDESIAEDLEAFVKVNKVISQLDINKSIRIWQNKREIYRNQNENIVDSFHRLESKTDRVGWSSILAYLELIQEYFPVVLVPKETYQKYKDKLNFDLVVFENLQYYVDLLPELLPNGKAVSQLFAIVEKEDVQKIKKAFVVNNKNEKITEIELKGYHQQGMISLLDMNYNERLYAARNLAHLLETANKNIKIFRYNNVVIFSTLDEILNKVLMKLLGEKGLKESRVIDTPFHMIIDNILEVNTKQILITQNNLLNFDSVDNLLWQLYAINKIRKSGIKIVNFNTSLLFDDAVSSIKDFVRKNFT